MRYKRSVSGIVSLQTNGQTKNEHTNGLVCEERKGEHVRRRRGEDCKVEGEAQSSAEVRMEKGREEDGRTIVELRSLLLLV